MEYCQRDFCLDPVPRGTIDLPHSVHFILHPAWASSLELLFYRKDEDLFIKHLALDKSGRSKNGKQAKTAEF